MVVQIHAEDAGIMNTIEIAGKFIGDNQTRLHMFRRMFDYYYQVLYCYTALQGSFKKRITWKEVQTRKVTERNMRKGCSQKKYLPHKFFCEYFSVTQSFLLYISRGFNNITASNKENTSMRMPLKLRLPQVICIKLL